MFSKFKHCKGMAVLTLLLQLAWLCPLSAAADKTVWYEGDTAPEGVTNVKKLTNRRALVGSGCMVNRIGNDGVSVVPVITNLENICDEDLTNTATMANVIKANVAAGPLISVRDVKNHYAAGTKAGFIVTASESKLLALDLGDAFSIMFYLEGKLQETVAVESGQEASALGLSLIQIGTSESCKEYVATSTKEFDEIRLTQVGVLSVSVAANLGIKYAFVGKSNEFTITKNTTNGISNYCTYTNRADMDVQGRLLSTSSWTHAVGDYDFIDTNNSNYTLTYSADIQAVPSDEGEAFKAGMQVGFKYSGFSVLAAGKTFVMELYSKDDEDNPVQKQTLKTDVLELLKYDSGLLSITAEKDFSRVKIYIPGLTVGGVNIYYAFVSFQPEIETHKCDLNPSADLSVCDCDNQYQLTASKDVSWTVKEQADEKNNPVSISQNGLVTGLVTPGKYVFTATASAAYCTGSTLCSEDVTINYGASDDIKPTTTSTVERLTGDGYTTSYGNNVDISLFSSLKNSKALTTTSLRDYAYYTGGVELAGKEHIISVKKASGTFKYDTDKYAGFVVTTKTNVLKADLLDFLGINLYKNGKKVDVTLTADNGVLKADLGSSDNVQQRVNYVVKVPAGTEFDEIALVKGGTLSANLSQLNIYYAYISDDNGNPESTGTVVSYNNTGAYIDTENTTFASVANVANTPFGLTNLVDDDLTTSFIYPGVAVASGTKVGVKLGRTINHAKQNLLIVTSCSSAVLEADLIKVMKIELYKNGKQVGTNESGGTGFDVLSANVLGYQNNHSYISVTSSVDYDEVVLTRGSGLTLASDYEVYGLLLRNDYNQDGLADDIDPEPCDQELVLDEDVTLNKTKNYTKTRMIFSRTFNGGMWNTLILPVNLTKAQFNEAFGSDAKLAEANNVEVTTEGETTVKTLMFQAVTEETDGVFLKKNTPYIVWLSTTEVDDHSADEQYESIDDGTVSGPLYFVESGVSFTYNDITPQTAGTGFAFTGSYDSKQALEAGWYILNKGTLYHATKAHTQKAYRCWINYNAAGTNSAPLNGFGIDDSTTGVTTVISGDAQPNDGRLYNLSGQRVSPSHALSRGLYIMNGKKFIVK